MRERENERQRERGRERTHARQRESEGERDQSFTRSLPSRKRGQSYISNTSYVYIHTCVNV